MQPRKMNPLVKTLAAGIVAITALPSIAVAERGFVEAEYIGNEMVLHPAELPKETTGVKVNVVYTPDKLDEASYIDERTYKGGSTMAYPFFDELKDGVYTWEVRVETDGLKYGYKPNQEEGQIDRNGRQVAIVGETFVPKGRTILPNRGRDLTQIGSFRVINGKIVNDPDLVEKD